MGRMKVSRRTCKRCSAHPNYVCLFCSSPSGRREGGRNLRKTEPKPPLSAGSIGVHSAFTPLRYQQGFRVPELHLATRVVAMNFLFLYDRGITRSRHPCCFTESDSLCEYGVYARNATRTTGAARQSCPKINPCSVFARYLYEIGSREGSGIRARGRESLSWIPV